MKERRFKVKKITTIVAKSNLLNVDKIPGKIKGYAYCRVSTESLKQAESFEMQTKYYEIDINNKSGWMFVDIYADQGISGIK